MPTGVFIRTTTHNRRISETMKGRKPNNAGKIRSEKTREKISKTQSLVKEGVSKSQYEKEVRSESCKRTWQNPEYRDKQIKAIMAGSSARPNNAEYLLGKLINIACPNEYEYSGNGSYVIGGMAPDFFNINSKKKVIEMFGDHWHQGEDPQIKIDKYFKSGYDCLVIWEKELKNHENVIMKIREFNNQGQISNRPLEKAAPLFLNQQLNMFNM